MERLSSYPQRVKEINKSKTLLQEGVLLLPSCVCALHGRAIHNIKKSYAGLLRHFSSRNDKVLYCNKFTTVSQQVEVKYLRQGT